jgi:hypothetical protein
MKLKIRLAFCYCFILSIAFSQNKKDRIELLTKQSDSLNQLVETKDIFEFFYWK